MKRNRCLWMLAALFLGFVIPACSDDENGGGQNVNGGPTVSLDVDTLYLQLDDSTRVIQATVIPEGDYDFYWSRTEPVVSIDSIGQVIPLEVGITELAYTLVESGNRATCWVVVQPATVKSLTMDEENYFVDLELGKQDTVHVNPWPTFAANKEIIWTSSDESVVTVEDMGQPRFYDYIEARLTAIGVGTATITATAAGNPEATTSFSVEVRPSFYFLDENNAEVETLTVNLREKDESTNYQIRLTPDNLDYTYAIADWNPTDVASVDENGVIRGLKGGTTAITVSALGISKTITVEVEDHDPFVFQIEDMYGGTFEDTMGFASLGVTEMTDSWGMEYHTTCQIVTVPKGEGEYKFTYESSDPFIATVDENGLVTAVSAGTSPYYPAQCVIYVTAGLTTHEFWVSVYSESMIY